ncbi:hypothetical protein ACQBJO_11485 [Janibacter sp. G349]|uniref:hypothetical protein n=1 Tax=Janibacter sp. G349 TaxID=3405424 RepID=UPI003D2E2983
MDAARQVTAGWIVTETRDRRDPGGRTRGDDELVVGDARVVVARTTSRRPRSIARTATPRCTVTRGWSGAGRAIAESPRVPATTSLSSTRL